MRIELREGLPYVTVRIEHNGAKLELDGVLLDTGSAGTVFPSDSLAKIGLVYEPDDSIHRIQGVGGSEFAFVKRIDLLTVGKHQVRDFAVEVSAMDYGFELGGIIGTDFLVAVRAVVNLGTLELD